MAKQKSEINRLLEEQNRDLRESSSRRRQDDEKLEPEIESEPDEINEDGRGAIIFGDAEETDPADSWVEEENEDDN